LGGKQNRGKIVQKYIILSNLISLMRLKNVEMGIVFFNNPQKSIFSVLKFLSMNNYLSEFQKKSTFVEQNEMQIVSIIMNKQELIDIRTDFPILNEKIYNKDLIYFDNGATTQKPKAVVETINNGYYHLNANIH